MDQEMMGGEQMPEEVPAEEGETTVVQIECRHTPEGDTYAVGLVSGDGADLQPAASLDEALRAAQALLQGDGEAGEAQAEKDFEQGFSGGKPTGY